MTNQPDELLPAADSPATVARRRALVRERRAWITGAIAAALVVVLLVVVAAASGGGGSRAARSKIKARTRTTSSRPARTTTTTGDGSSTSSTTAGSASGGSNGGTTAGGPTSTSPPGTAGSDLSQYVTIKENPGICSWHSDTQELVDTGTVLNRGNSEAVVDFEVTWSDSSGELDTWDDLETVPAHGSIPWEGSSGWTDPVSGATCQIALVSATASGT